MKWGVYESSSRIQTAHYGLIYSFFNKALYLVIGQLRMIGRRCGFVSYLFHLVAVCIIRDKQRSLACATIKKFQWHIPGNVCISLTLHLPRGFVTKGPLLLIHSGTWAGGGFLLTPALNTMDSRKGNVNHWGYLHFYLEVTHNFCHISSASANHVVKGKESRILPCA